MKAIELRYYQTADGEKPFVGWLGRLMDEAARSRIQSQVMVLLLCGGDKRTQQRDIERAKKYFKDYKDRSTQKPGGRT